MEANSSAIDGRVYLRRHCGHRDSDLPLKLAPPVAASTVTVTVPLARGVRRPRALLKGLFAVPPAVTRTCH
jgi:hypothetical protein